MSVLILCAVVNLSSRLRSTLLNGARRGKKAGVSISVLMSKQLPAVTKLSLRGNREEKVPHSNSSTDFVFSSGSKINARDVYYSRVALGVYFPDL